MSDTTTLSMVFLLLMAVVFNDENPRPRLLKEGNWALIANAKIKLGATNVGLFKVSVNECQ